MDDLNLAELGLGGSPTLLEQGLDAEGISILTKVEMALSRDLSGICRDDRFGRLGC